MDPLVSDKQPFLDEGLVALQTGKELLAGVTPPMYLKFGFCLEGFPALRTQQWTPLGGKFPSGISTFFGIFPVLGAPAVVGPLMFDQRILLYEVLPAVRTGVQHLPRVRSPVKQEVVFATETLPALETRKGSLARVDPVVRFQVSDLPEAFSALRAAVGPLVGVFSQVAHQVRLVPEGFPALRAQIGPRPSVIRLMTRKFRPPFKTLPALRA